MKKLALFLVLALCVAGTAIAGKDVIVERLDATDYQQVIAQDRQVECYLGNPNPAYWMYSDFIWGAEEYKYMFFPPETCQCPLGFKVEFIHFLVHFDVEDVPVTFDAYVDVEEALWDDILQCWVPGPELCVSEIATITITDPGNYDIGMPINSCECMFMDYWYGLSYHFVDFLPEYIDILSDEFPVGCTSWVNYGTGWYDLINFGFLGEIVMWADAVCCEPPVANEDKAWGDVKNLYE